MFPKLTIKKILLATVFTTGASVLIIEVAAVRFLSPYFGSSLYVLSSVLTTILLALAIGYYFGGKLSDRFPYHSPLYEIIGLSAFATLFLTCAAIILLENYGNFLPILIGPLFFSLLLFFTPAFLLGIDSPYVIKLLSMNVDDSARGEIVGSTFFWSTAGSITGSITSGFILIPILGLINTMVLVGLTLLTLSFLGLFLIKKKLAQLKNYDKRNDKRFLLPASLIIIGSLISLSFIYTKTNDSNIVFQTDGYYSKITIIDTQHKKEPVRFLKRDTNFSSALFLEKNDFFFEYAQFVNTYPDLLSEAKNVLILGGGAYTIPRHLHLNNPSLLIDVVELEPKLYDISKKYFDLPETDKIKNYTQDARVFVSRNEKKYDLIFTDTFNSGHYIPNHLITTEFISLLKERLSPEGILMINFVSTRIPFKHSLIGSFSKTLLKTFPNTKLYIMNLETNPDDLQNFIFISRNGTEAIKPNPNFNIISNITEKSIKISELEIDPYGLINNKDAVFRDFHSSSEILLLKNRLIFY